MIRKAASSLRAFKSLPFVFTMSITCLRVTLPTLVLLGSLEPAAMLAAFFNKIAAGGVFVVELKEFSFLTGVTNRRKSAAWLLVGGVNYLLDGLQLRSRGPRAD